MRLRTSLAALLACSLPRGASAEVPPLSPTLAAQLRLGAELPRGGDAEPAALELRRVRLGLRLRAMDARLRGALVLNTTPASLELVDLWVEYRARPHVLLRVGQTKQPFTAYRLGRFTDLHFVDWALVTRAFGGARQLGAELHNRGEGGPWEYSAGVWNGASMRASHGRGVADLYAQPVANPSDLRRYDPPAALHPELTVRAAYHRVGRVGWDLGVSAAVDLAPEARRELRVAVAPEASLRVGPVRADVTGYFGASDLVHARGFGVTWGALAELGVTLARRVTLGARYASLVRDAALVEDARRDPTESPATSLGPDQEHELGVAVDVRLPDTPVSANADASWLHTRASGAWRDGARLRVQLQIAVR